MKQQSNEMKKSNKKVSNLESEQKKIKLKLGATEQLKLDLTAVEETRDSNYATDT